MTAMTERRAGAPPRLAILARAPVRGRVKRRLARAVGEDAALDAYRELVASTLDRLAPGRGAFAPEIWVDGDAPVVAEWRRRFPVRVQPPGDLGERMAAAFAAGARALVGCDIPNLDAAYVEAALARLVDADVVLGPTADGGYCLIAMNAPAPRLFADIPWGGAEVLSATIRAAAPLVVRLLPPLWDVDRPEDLARWRRQTPRGHCRGMPAGAQAGVAGVGLS